MKAHGQIIDDDLLPHLSPLGWEHINLTGNYVWRNSTRLGDGIQAVTPDWREIKIGMGLTW